VSEQEASPRTPSAPLHWRVRICRWLWRVLGFVWGTLLVGIVIGTIANLNTTAAGTPLSTLFIIHLALTYPLLVWSSLGLLALLTLLSWLGSREKQATRARPLSEQDRIHMLRRLRLRYEQLLRQSLQGAVQLELGLASRPSAVQNAASLALRLPDQPEQPLPPHTTIVKVYELAQQELLILGAPGAGKSMLLLELAHSLVEQAEQDASHLLPVLVPLSSWATKREPLQDWLAEQVALLYDIPRSLSRQWIQAQQLLPLLDGLDEMDVSARAACITAINTYHREYLGPLVVCSRTDEYEGAAARERLRVHTAVIVQPLSPAQVETHLADLGKPLAALRAALKKQPLLQTMATTPLLLQVLMLTYHGTSVRELPHKEVQLRQQVWTDYVERMVSRKGDAKRYPLRVTTTRLGWLAAEMRQRNQTIFFLEQFQPDWLPKRRRILYQWGVGLLLGLFYGLLFGLLLGLLFGLVGGLVGGLLGLVFGLLLGLDTKIEPAEALTWYWKTGLLGGLVVGLLSGLFFGLLFGLVVGLVFGLVVGLVVGLSERQLTERLALSPNEGMRRSLKNGLLLMLVIGPVGGLLFGLVIGPVGGLLFGLLSGPVIGPVGGLQAVVQHYTLRFWLACSGVLPWKAVPFLEDATARILLRRVGGGYSFAHRLLLDFFADSSAGVSSASLAAQDTQPFSS
jgi:NACHT domain